MSWKKQFARRIRFVDLDTIGPFRLSETEPEPLGKGKYRVELIQKDGQKLILSTYETTIGDMLSIKNWIEAYKETGNDNEEYIRFKEAE